MVLEFLECKDKVIELKRLEFRREMRETDTFQGGIVKERKDLLRGHA